MTGSGCPGFPCAGRRLVVEDQVGAHCRAQRGPWAWFSWQGPRTGIPWDVAVGWGSPVLPGLPVGLRVSAVGAGTPEHPPRPTPPLTGLADGVTAVPRVCVCVGVCVCVHPMA